MRSWWRRDRDQDVKRGGETFKTAGRTGSVAARSVYRPWGFSRPCIWAQERKSSGSRSIPARPSHCNIITSAPSTGWWCLVKHPSRGDETPDSSRMNRLTFLLECSTGSRTRATARCVSSRCRWVPTLARTTSCGSKTAINGHLKAEMLPIMPWPKRCRRRAGPRSRQWFFRAPVQA